MTTQQTDEAQEAQQAQEAQPEARKAVTRLVLIVAAGLVAAVATGVTKTVAVVLALIVMIMLHELGHFVMAKVAGMKVTEYFLGFGPRLWSVRKGETEYGIKALPLGGYVKIVGMTNIEEVAPEDEDRTYRQKGYWQRLGVGVAGSAVHFLLALVILFSLFAFVGTPDQDNPQPVVATISRLESGPSPAQQAGFRVGDRIVAVDGQPVGNWDELPAYIRARPGQEIAFTVDRDGRRLDLRATPVDLASVRVEGRPAVDRPTGFVGIGPEIPVVRESPGSAMGKAVSGVGRLTRDTVGAIVRIFSPSGLSDYASQITGRVPAEGEGDTRFLSPVGFVRVAGQAAESGLRDVLFLLVVINIFVGAFNMIPLLPLDGGHVAIATYEAIRSRKGRRYFVDGRKAMAAAYPVVLLLVFIGISALYVDIVRPLSNPFR